MIFVSIRSWVGFRTLRKICFRIHVWSYSIFIRIRDNPYLFPYSSYPYSYSFSYPVKKKWKQIWYEHYSSVSAPFLSLVRLWACVGSLVGAVVCVCACIFWVIEKKKLGTWKILALGATQKHSYKNKLLLLTEPQQSGAVIWRRTNE